MRGVLQPGHALVVVVVAHGADEHVDAPAAAVGHRVEHLGDVERGLAEVDEAYDGQGGGHGPSEPSRAAARLDAASSLDP